ncbi:MAG TPA: Rieske 2Fe-2S domain-containing protein [Stellaceae bacterium]|nr:Rieske 2Fe-2S domain-containing protein [Stellaceae bacterium]
MAEVDIGRLQDFGAEDHRVVEVDGVEIGVFRVGKKVVAYKNECPHYGGPVCQGKIFQQTEEQLGPDKTSRGLKFSAARNIVCPWHGYEFNLETGCHPGDPRVKLEPIAVAVRDARVYLQVPDAG